jgi:para-nitrobenzyl esterase
MKFNKNTRLLFVAILLVTVCAFKAVLTNSKKSGDAFDKVLVDGGYISGTVNTGGDIHIFKGIPFAVPPVATLRWKAPQPVKPWSGVKMCDKFGPSPLQHKPVPFSMWSQEFLIPSEPISEDCLYLNVWTGAASPKEKRAVIVWIYGGGFTSGGSAVPIYDGEAMAKKGVVFVSINYRVGIFGFFACPALTKESGHNASGNYGLMDQLSALQWVQKNIAAFGGDPGNVTIAGLARGLFQKAIGESGASFTNGNPTLQQAEDEGKKIMESLHVSSLNDLRSLPGDELIKQPKNFSKPIIDGYVLPDAIVNIFKEQKENKVSLLTGWNQDEGLFFGPVKNAVDFKKEVQEQYGKAAQAFLRFYPADNDSEAAVFQLHLSRDMIFGMQNYEWANFQNMDVAKCTFTVLSANHLQQESTQNMVHFIPPRFRMLMITYNMLTGPGSM